jgi:tetratricopeptide (TPR) repeat protein
MDEGLDTVRKADIIVIVDKVLAATKSIMEKFGIVSLSPSRQTPDNIDSLPMVTLQKVNALARNSIHHLIKHNPSDAMLYNKIGVTYRRSGDTKSALQMYKKAMDIDPDDHRIRVNYAAANALLGSWDIAAKEIEKAIELDSDGYDQYISKALLGIIAKKDKGKLEKILI